MLTPGKQRGTWLVSEKEYGDFVLEFEIKLTERGNSGVALRAPMKGDPAFDGMELQVADLRYNTAGEGLRADRRHLPGRRPDEAGLQADRVEHRAGSS